MTKTISPATTAKRMLVSIDLRSMSVYDENGRDACLRMLDVRQDDQANVVFVNRSLCNVDGFELYGELLSFFATPVSEGSQRG